MQSKPHSLFSPKRVLFIITPCLVMLVCCTDWVVPTSLVGTWSYTQELTIRYKEENSSYHFVRAPVTIVMTIQNDETVTASVGEAKLEGCFVAQNRGWFFRMLDFNTDYQIKGKLTGRIFAQDTLGDKEISVPFNVKDNSIEGTLFYINGMESFPMVGIKPRASTPSKPLHLTKQ